MITFHKNTIKSYVDLPNHTSIIFHSISCSCNFNCYGCFNYDMLIGNTNIENTYTEKDILEILELQGYIFDAIIFSGGEFLMNNLEDIENLFKIIKEKYNKKIIVYTNGTFPHKIQYLFDKKLVDGFHIDIKLPYHLLDLSKDKNMIKGVLGIELNEDVREIILKSLEIILKNNSIYSQIRTVKYPILENDIFIHIEEYVESLKLKYNAMNVKYYLNDFIYV